jgi:uroporphyrinogen decarboxylase
MSKPLLVRACRGEQVERVPVWIMRQAGRYLPEYQAVRRRAGFIEICSRPELAAEVTLQPVRRLGVDAAIIFHDILLPLRPMGAGFEFDDKPRLERPIRSREQVEAMRKPDPREAFALLCEALRLVRRELPPEVALMGFSGAPFTLANYLIEGGASSDNLETKKMIARDPKTVHALLDRLADAMVDFLGAQVDAGAQVLQIFESSGGVLAPRDYAEFALPYALRVIGMARAAGVPVIFFPRGCGAYIERFADCGADVIGVDWQTPLGEARRRLGDGVGVQGNLDPAALLGTPESIETKVAETLDEAGDRRGFIFNLGHGILPSTPPENAEALVRAVKELSAREA